MDEQRLPATVSAMPSTKLARAPHPTRSIPQQIASLLGVTALTMAVPAAVAAACFAVIAGSASRPCGGSRGACSLTADAVSDVAGGSAGVTTIAAAVLVALSVALLAAGRIRRQPASGALTADGRATESTEVSGPATIQEPEASGGTPVVLVRNIGGLKVGTPVTVVSTLPASAGGGYDYLVRTESGDLRAVRSEEISRTS